MSLSYRNVTQALRITSRVAYDDLKAVKELGGHSNPYAIEETRNGDALIYQTPRLFTYTNPRQRVLFNDARNANPFFHLIESLWMLAGRNTVDPLHHFCRQITEYSDDTFPPGKPGESTFHGAYGYRWRKAFYCHDGNHWDQLTTIIRHLHDYPNSRRAVLQMWAAQLDLNSPSKDLPCNMLVTFQIKTRKLRASQIDWLPTYTDPHNPNNPLDDTGAPLNIQIQKDGTPLLLPDSIPANVEIEGPDPLYAEHDRTMECPSLRPPRTPEYLQPSQLVTVKVLDMTVHNRSNDMVWGLFGANAVHFSILQEYVAIALGLQVGYMHTVTDNLHIYERHWDKLAAYAIDDTHSAYSLSPGYPPDEWKPTSTKMVPLFNSLYPLKDHVAFTQRCNNFIDWVSEIFSENCIQDNRPTYHNSVGDLPSFYTEEHKFLQTVAHPAMLAYWHYKQGQHQTAHDYLSKVAAPDWRSAMTSWIKRRQKKAGVVAIENFKEIQSYKLVELPSCSCDLTNPRTYCDKCAGHPARKQIENFKETSGHPPRKQAEERLKDDASEHARHIKRGPNAVFDDITLKDEDGNEHARYEKKNLLSHSGKDIPAAIKELRDCHDGPIIAPSKAAEIPEEHEACRIPGCKGKYSFGPVEGCTCHITYPCSACTNNPLLCSVCGDDTIA